MREQTGWKFFYGTLHPDRCRANSAHIRQSRLEYGLGFEVKSFKPRRLGGSSSTAPYTLTAVERRLYIYDSQGQILALAFRSKPFKLRRLGGSSSTVPYTHRPLLEMLNSGLQWLQRCSRGERPVQLPMSSELLG